MELDKSRDVGEALAVQQGNLYIIWYMVKVNNGSFNEYSERTNH